MQIAIGYASVLTMLFFLWILNKQIAYTKLRAVDLSEEVIVITGGASGLELLIAEELESGEARGVTAYKCDVGNKEDIARVAVEIERDLGTPTILINNAAVVNGKPLIDLSIEDIERNFRVNILSHLYILKTFLPGMIRDGQATIVKISSVIGKLGAASLSDYSASKAGITAMHKSLAAELASTPEIRTILVTPGQLSRPLFNGVKTPKGFFGPVLEAVDVVKEVIAAIDSGSSSVVAVPLYARWIDWMNVAPVGAQAILRKLSGIDSAMKAFKGRTEDLVEQETLI